MQRRAAAIYFAFFLVLGAAAYGYIGVAQSSQQPDFRLDGTTLESNESTTIGGTEYTIAELGHESGGGGHGGGGGALVATLEWTNDSAQQTATLENDSTLTYENTSYTVVVPNGSEGSFVLQEQLNVTQILSNDDAVENSVVSRDGTDYVVFRENDSIRPASEYLPAPETREFSTGDSFQYEGADATVAEVSSSGVTLEWTGPVDNSEELQEGTNVTLANGEQYFTHFPDGQDEAVSLVHSDQYASYDATLSQRDYFHERMNGLWGIVIISLSAALLVLSMAYLPHRG